MVIRLDEPRRQFATSAGAIAALETIALADLSDVGGTSGTGDVVLLSGSPAITTPTIAQINGSVAGLAVATFVDLASAVNYLQLTAATTGVGVQVSATGSDADVNLRLRSKGAGIVTLNGVQAVDVSTAQALSNKSFAAGSGSTIDASLLTSGLVSAARMQEVLALADLTDVTGTSGTGTVVLLQGSPAITTPAIASFTNSQHGHLNAAGGGTLAKTALTTWPGSFQSHANAGTSPWECWYALGVVSSTALTTAALVVNTLYAYPFVAPERGGALDRLAVEVTTLAALGNARIGIYSPTSSTNLYPSALVIDAGAVSTAAVGMSAATISQALTPGALYYAAIVVDVAPSVRGGNNQLQVVLGYPSAGGTTPYWGCTVAQAYGALPAPFPSGAALQSGAPRPVLFSRFSA